MTVVNIKQSNIPYNIPKVEDLELGEIAVNTHDGKMYMKKNAGGVDSVVLIGIGNNDIVQTGLDREATTADRIQTGLDKLATAADKSQTGLDRVATAADRTQTSLDRVAVTTNRSLTEADSLATAADRVQTNLDRIAIENTVLLTAADRAATSADRIQTGQDRIVTEDNAIHTSSDRVATTADRIQTGADRIRTEDNSVQTRIDREATAADRAQTTIDRINASNAAITCINATEQTNIDKQSTAADRIQVRNDAISTAADREIVTAAVQSILTAESIFPDVGPAKIAKSLSKQRSDMRRKTTRDGWRLGASAWEPITGLGAKLAAWWDVDTYATLMVDSGGGLISSWTDRVLGRTLTASGAARPTYKATGLYGRPCVSFDGIANVLSTSTLTGIPTGSSAGGLVVACGPWVASTITHAAGYGSTSANAARRFSSNTSGFVTATTGTVAQTGTTTNVPLNILIGEWTATTGSLYQNGITSSDSPETLTLATATSYFRVGASLAITPSQFAAIQITDIIVINGTLTAYERKKLEGFLAWKRSGGQALTKNHPHFEFVPLAGSRSKSAQPLRYVTSNNQKMNSISSVVDINTGFKGRIVEMLGGDDCSDIQVGFSNWFIDNQITAAAETDNVDNVTISKAAIVYDGISIPLTFNGGSRSVVLAAGETLKLSDTIDASSFGHDRFKSRTVIEVRYMGEVASSTSKMIYSDRGMNEFSTTIKDQGFQYPVANAIDDIDNIGNMSTPTGNIGDSIIRPTAIIGRFDGTPPVIDVYADSIPHGVNDFKSGGISSNGVGGLSGVVNGGGWIRRSLMNLGLSYAITSKIGRQYRHMAANYTKQSVFFKYATHAIFTLGTDDLNDDITASSIVTSASSIWDALRAAGVKGIYHSTILPRVANNQYFNTDLEHQAPDIPFVNGGERDRLNQILQNSAPGLLDGIIDISFAVSDPRDRSKWAVPNFNSSLASPITSSDTSVILTSLPATEACIVVEPGTTNAEAASLNILSTIGNVAEYSSTPFALPHTAGSNIKVTIASDGTNPSAQAHYIMSLVAMPIVAEIEDVI